MVAAEAARLAAVGGEGAAVRAGRADELVPFAGQTVGLIDAIVPVRAVIEELVAGAAAALEAVSAAR